MSTWRLSIKYSIEKPPVFRLVPQVVRFACLQRLSLVPLVIVLNGPSQGHRQPPLSMLVKIDEHNPGN